ncbi:MAG: glycosyltransferase family 4 protein, partial [Spirochaetaceae bacterium]
HVPAARRLARRADARLVVALRSDMIAELRAFGAHRGPRLLAALLRPAEELVLRCRERAACRSASAIVFQTARDRDAFIARHPEVTRKAHPKGAAEPRTPIIANSLNASWFDPRLRDANRSENLSRLLYVGSLNRRKGLDVLLEAFALLHAEHPGLTLEIVGTGPLEAELRRHARRLGLGGTEGSAVTFLGYDPAPVARIAGADLLVLPSRYDSFPNVLLEALHTGTPAVATDSGGSREILDSDELLVPPEDPRALAAAIGRLVGDPGAYARARAHMRDRRKELEFDWVARFEAVLGQ